VEKKVMAQDRTRVDDAISEDGDGADAAYDSDLDKELEADAEVLAKQAPEDEHKKLIVQDRARLDATAWSTQVLPPSQYTPAENSEYKPEEAIGLDFVHGYRGWDCLSNVHYTITEEIAYFAAGLGIVYEPKSGRQKHYNGPSTRPMREVISMAMHPSGRFQSFLYTVLDGIPVRLRVCVCV
jgi:microtubule-associated protein-like 5